MRRVQMFVAAVFVLSLPFVSAPALAERDCPGGVCKCAGTDDCKKLDMSGQCNGPITCGAQGQQCRCPSKAKATTNSIIQKKPVDKKSQ